MALDAVAAETVSDGGPASVRVYGWEPSTLTLGAAQNPTTIDWEHCRRAGVEITRRPTGGGAIYHDAVGDVSYSIVVPRDSLPDDLLESYHILCQPVQSALASLGVEATFADSAAPAIHEPVCYLRDLNPAHDLVVSTPDGPRKISGNAQHRQRDAIVQHGSITVRSTPEAHLACFSTDSIGPETFRGRVCGLVECGVSDREAVIESLETTLRDTFDASTQEWSSSERDRATELVDTKFGADSWVREGQLP